MKDLITIPVPSKNAKAFWWPKNSMLELLPASLAWQINEPRVKLIIIDNKILTFAHMELVASFMVLLVSLLCMG